MISKKEFVYNPNEDEAEAASNSYIMSLVAVVVGLPLPIINLLATFIFFLSNRKSGYFVRWHCTQALLSQFTLLLINSTGFWWTFNILFRDTLLTSDYVGYLIALFLFNLTEFVVTIYSAIHTRKGKHVEWWFYGQLTHLLCRK